MVGGLVLFSTNANATENGHGHSHGGDSHSHGDEGGHGDEAAAHGEGHGGGAPIINWTDLGFGDKNEVGEPIEKGGTPMAPPLLFALLNFAIFAGILYWKAGPALSKFLANRHEQIKSALEEGAKLQEEAKEKLKEYSARIADADAEVNALIAQIKKDAEAEREKLIGDAKDQAKRMQEDAEARIESEFAAARRELEREVVAKAVEVASTMLAEKSSSADQGTLFSAFITDLKSSASDSKDGGQA
jgi:F-type H+-transporting ATPase subunit b